MSATPAQSAPCSNFIRWLVVASAAIALCLVGYGVFLTPATRARSIAAAVAILLAYAAIGWFVIPMLSSRYPAALQVAEWAGLGAAAVFVAEICLEYALLPKDNTPWGLAEFGLVFFLYTCAGTWLGSRKQKLREAIIGSALSAIVSSIVWAVFILATFYLFWGTTRQHAVFQAEGNFDDFRQSGMSDFRAFITEDFFGATFFHLLLGPLLAGVLGLAGGGIGKGLAVLRKRFARSRLD